MKCVMCGRAMAKAAAEIPAQTSGPMPHPPGPVGPTCARNAGMVKPRPQLFTVKRRARVVRPSPQLDLGL